jgi:hypothetical protein
MVEQILAAHGVAAQVHEVLVADKTMADELGFAGSPTIRVNGRDVTGDASRIDAVGLNCRLYAGSDQVGLPPVEMVRRAILEAQRGDSQ